MPEYIYRREDGTMFTVRQKFSEDALSVDPETGQNVVRVVQPAGIIFKGSGFYVNDSKQASKRNLNGSTNGNGHGDNDHSDHSSNGNGNGNGHNSNGNGSSSDNAPKAETKKETTAVNAADN